MSRPESPPAARAGTLALPAARIPRSREDAIALARAAWAPLLLAAIAVVAAAVRVYDIAGNPAGFFADEASYGYNAYSILHTGKDEFGSVMPVFFKAFGEYKLPVYTYSLVPFIAALGLSEESVRLTSAAYGILTVAGVYFLMRAMFRSQLLGLIAAATLAISPWHIFYSRTGLGEVITWPFFLVLSLYLFYAGTRRPVFWLLAGLSFGLTLYAYRPAWVTLPPLLLILAALYHRELIAHWRYAIGGALVLGVVALAIPLHLMSVEGDRSQEQWIFGLDLSTQDTIERFINQYRLHFTQNFLFDGHGEPNIRHVVVGEGWLYYWQVPFLFLGFAALLVPPARPKLVILSLLLLFPVATAVTQGSPSSSRAVLGSIAFTLVTAYGIWAAVNLLSSVRWRREAQVAGLVLAGVVLVGTSTAGALDFRTFLDRYHGTYPNIAADFGGWQWGPREIIERFEEAQDEYDELYMEPAFNAPGIFLNFYAPEGCAGCGVAFWDYYKPGIRQLFAIVPASLPLAYDLDVKEILYYPNGTAAFVITEITSGPSLPREFDPPLSPGPPQQIADLDRAISEDPTNADLYARRASAHWAIGNSYQALNDYGGAIANDPNHVIAYYNRGLLHVQLGVFDLAMTDFGSALALDPDLAVAHNGAAAIHNRVQEYDLAIAKLDAAIRAAPDSARPYANRAAAQLGMGEPLLALADANRAVELEPSMAYAYVTRGRASVAAGQPDRALPDYDRAIELDASYAEAYLERGTLLLEREEAERAIADLDRAVELDRDLAAAYAQRGAALLATGEIERALSDLERAIALDRGFVNQASERNPQFQWGLGAAANSLRGRLGRALGDVGEAQAAGRLERVIDYLDSRG